MASLPTISGSGAQTSTQNPQTAGQGNPGGAKTGQVQPGGASSLLAQPAPGTVTGVPLNDTPVTTVDLGARQTSTGTQTPKTEPVPARHINPALFGVSAILFILAIALFWFTSRSEKNTTN